MKRFRREAQAVARLSHPNIVSIYDVGEDKEVYYLVMEYVEGKNLKQVIQERQRLSPLEAIDFALQICEALEHAHESGIIHRDIKPHNILITKNGKVKVTDFGIAQAATGVTMTYSGSIIGSVQYISPEQARGEVTSIHTDLYSAGIVLYEMVTGRLPFDGDTAIGIAIKHIQEECPSPGQSVPDFPKELEAVICKALAKNPEDRYESAGAMKRALEQVQRYLEDGLAATPAFAQSTRQQERCCFRARRSPNEGQTYYLDSAYSSTGPATSTGLLGFAEVLGGQ
ncbi:MAG: protein kinase domain-containing protein [Bacillota bacterium]